MIKVLKSGKILTKAKVILKIQLFCIIPNAFFFILLPFLFFLKIENQFHNQR